MTNQSKTQRRDRKFASAYWEVYYGVLGKETGAILKGLLAPSEAEEPDWVRMDGAIRDRFGWLADVIRKEAGKRSQVDVDKAPPSTHGQEGTHRRARK